MSVEEVQGPVAHHPGRQPDGRMAVEHLTDLDIELEFANFGHGFLFHLAAGMPMSAGVGDLGVLLRAGWGVRGWLVWFP